MAEPRLWSKDFTVAIIAAVFLSFVFYLLITTMAGYAVIRFAASDSAAGLASSSFVLGAVAARMFVGTMLDTLGRYRVLITAFTLSAVAGALYLPADSLPLLLAVRFVHGAVFGAGHTAIMAAVQDIIPPSRGRRAPATSAHRRPWRQRSARLSRSSSYATSATTGCSSPPWPSRCSGWSRSCSCAYPNAPPMSASC